MSIPYYRFFPGDYARDTRHLSLMQHGVYRLLIDLYMDQSGPLRNDLPYLYRWLHAESVEEKNSVEFVLGEFFVLSGNRWTHKRCASEIEWRETKHQLAKKSASKRWNSKRNANAMRTHSDGNANQNQNQRKKNHMVNANAFDRFWSSYPKRVAKLSARSAWGRINPNDELVAAIIAAVEAQKKTDQWRRGFVPNPATWLNARRWDDEITAVSVARELAI